MFSIAYFLLKWKSWKLQNELQTVVLRAINAIEITTEKVSVSCQKEYNFQIKMHPSFVIFSCQLSQSCEILPANSSSRSELLRKTLCIIYLKKHFALPSYWAFPSSPVLSRFNQFSIVNLWTENSFYQGFPQERGQIRMVAPTRWSKDLPFLCKWFAIVFFLRPR